MRANSTEWDWTMHCRRQRNCHPWEWDFPVSLGLIGLTDRKNSHQTKPMVQFWKLQASGPRRDHALSKRWKTLFLALPHRLGISGVSPSFPIKFVYLLIKGGGLKLRSIQSPIEIPLLEYQISLTDVGVPTDWLRSFFIFYYFVFTKTRHQHSKPKTSFIYFYFKRPHIPGSTYCGAEPYIREEAVPKLVVPFLPFLCLVCVSGVSSGAALTTPFFSHILLSLSPI